MSKASRMTRKFSRPAVIRKVLPYSYDAAVTVPAPASISLRDDVRRADAAVGDRAEEHQRVRQLERKQPSLSHRPIANISGSAIRKIRPFCRRPCTGARRREPARPAPQTIASRPGSAAARGRSAAVDFVPIRSLHSTLQAAAGRRARVRDDQPGRRRTRAAARRRRGRCSADGRGRPSRGPT